MFTLLMLVIVVIGVVMTISILMQNPKGGGLSSAFGGASGGVGSMLGVRHASDILAKTTWGLAIAFTVLIFAVNMFFLPTEGTQDSIIQRQASTEPISPMQKQEQMQQQMQQEQPQTAQPQGEQPAPPPAPAN
ncbi:MAG: preprotein translocase subunit SecG [Bacteroidetes bacterium]|nr:preprotein translocase subunit SecG [Bacteroidota bacterium]